MLSMTLLPYAHLQKMSCLIGHVNIGIIFYCIGNSQGCICNTQSKSDWLFNTQSIVQHADWLILEHIEKTILNINMPYWCGEYTYMYFKFKTNAVPGFQKYEASSETTSHAQSRAHSMRWRWHERIVYLSLQLSHWHRNPRHGFSMENQIEKRSDKTGSKKVRITRIRCWCFATIILWLGF